LLFTQPLGALKGRSWDEQRFSLAAALLVVCRQPSRNPLGQHRGRHECFNLLSRLLRCFQVCIDGHGEATWERGSKTNCSGLWGMSLRVIGWVLADSGGRFLEKNSARRVFPRALQHCKVAAQLVPPRDPIWYSPGQVTMLARRGRLNGRMTWSARIHEIGVCLARFVYRHTDPECFLHRADGTKYDGFMLHSRCFSTPSHHNLGGALTVVEVAFRTRHTCGKVGQKRSLPALQSRGADGQGEKGKQKMGTAIAQAGLARARHRTQVVYRHPLPLSVLR
jgi:hypothetical protein